SASILEVTEEQLDQINEVANAWYLYTIEAGTYPRQEEDIQTIAQPNVLVATPDMDADFVYDLTKILYENQEFMIGVHNSARDMQNETDVDEINIPLKLVAYRYIEEQCLDIHDNLKHEKLDEEAESNE